MAGTYPAPHFASVTLDTPLTVSGGGTGSSSAATARSNLGAAASGANSDITSLSGLTTPLSVAQGGTGATTAAAALTALGAAALAGNSGQTFAVANATANDEAVALGQFTQQAVYAISSQVSGSVAQNSTAYAGPISITFPAFSKTGAFRVFAQASMSFWSSGGWTAAQPLTIALWDGTKQTPLGGATPTTSYYQVGASGFSSPTYSTGSSVTFQVAFVAGGTSVTTPFTIFDFTLFVQDA